VVVLLHCSYMWTRTRLVCGDMHLSDATDEVSDTKALDGYTIKTAN